MKVHTCGPMRDSFRLQQDSPEGDWRAEVLFEPQQAVDSYPFAHRQMQECDDKLSLYLPSLPTRKNRVAVVLRTAATSLLESDTHLGARYRHLRRQLPTFKAAVKAMARYLAVPIYRLLTHGEAWVDRGAALPPSSTPRPRCSTANWCLPRSS